MPQSIGIRRIDYVEFLVGNARQTTHYFCTTLGFRGKAFCHDRDRVSYLVEQGEICLMFTSNLHPTSDVAAQVHIHGDGIRTIAFEVDDAARSFEQAMIRGGRPFLPPQRKQDENGSVIIAGIHTYGDTIHLLVERENYHGPFLPGFESFEAYQDLEPAGLQYFDHILGNVGWKEMESWSRFYFEVLGFKRTDALRPSNDSAPYVAPMTLETDGHRIKMPVREPAIDSQKTRIENYLEYYKGPGVQYIAFSTDDILRSVRIMEGRGMNFLPVADKYDDAIIPVDWHLDASMPPLHDQHIRLKRDEEGYSLQSCTEPIADRPTVCIKIVQRLTLSEMEMPAYLNQLSARLTHS